MQAFGIFCIVIIFIGSLITISQIIIQYRTTDITEITPAPSFMELPITSTENRSRSNSNEDVNSIHGLNYSKIIHVRPKKADSESSLHLDTKSIVSSNRSRHSSIRSSRRYSSMDSKLSVQDLDLSRRSSSLRVKNPRKDSKDSFLSLDRSRHTRSRSPSIRSQPILKTDSDDTIATTTSKTPPLQRSKRIQSQDSIPILLEKLENNGQRRKSILHKNNDSDESNETKVLVIRIILLYYTLTVLW